MGNSEFPPMGSLSQVELCMPVGRLMLTQDLAHFLKAAKGKGHGMLYFPGTKKMEQEPPPSNFNKISLLLYSTIDVCGCFPVVLNLNELNQSSTAVERKLQVHNIYTP